MTELEYEVVSDLRSGKCLNDDQIDEIITMMVRSPEAQTKGFVIDLTFAKKSVKKTDEDEEGREYMEWGQRLQDKYILEGNELTHIIELACDDDEVKRRASGLMCNPKHSAVYSDLERKIRNKPKPVVLDEDGNPIEEEDPAAEDEEYEQKLEMGLVGPLIEQNMISRGCDSMDRFNREVE